MNVRKFGTLLVAAGTLVAGAGCQNDTLVEQYARFTLTALPTSSQRSLADPVGIDCGKVPMFGSTIARFELENISSSLVEINGVSVRDAVNGDFAAVLEIDNQTVSLPAELDTIGTDGAIAYLEVTYAPQGNDGALGSAIIELETNSGETHDLVVEVAIRGEAWFVGEPNLELQYAGETYAFPADCTFATGSEVCQLPTLAFGNVSLDSSATTGVTLRNVPEAGTCRLPTLPDGSADCTVTCAVTFDRDPDYLDLGIGFLPVDAGFGISGSSTVPFVLAPRAADCPNDPGQSMIRGELELVLRYDAADTAGDSVATLVLESNDPGAPLIEIPLSASAKEAPVAVAGLRLCDADNPPPDCTAGPDEIEPLQRVYFDGRDSYDPSGGTIESYRWEIIQYPDGANPASGIYAPVGAGTSLYTIYVPLAGDYVVRLHVTNSEGVESGIGVTSDVPFTAIPSSRLHLQLVWDHPENDQDLHLVQVNDAGEGLVYQDQKDCFWRNCKPECIPDPDCESPWWFPAYEVQQEANPRLDRDDTHGLGPENINVDRPLPGRYQVYAHYYGLTSLIDDVTQVTVRIYIDGGLRQEFREQLYRNEVWAVAEIVWNDDDTAVIISPDPELDPIQVLFPLPPADEGWTFDPSPF